MTVPSRLPVVQAPMAAGPATPELAAAVNGAGGFGFVAGGYLTPDTLRAALERTRALTSEQIGVNLFVPGAPERDRDTIAAYGRSLQAEADRFGVQLGEPRWEDDSYPAKVDVLMSAGVHTVSFTFGCPAGEAVRRLQRAGANVAVTVTSRAEAEQAAAVGADLLVVQGTEAGGHQGTFAPETPNNTPLLDAVRDIAGVGRPMIAAGGIMTAADARAAFDAGAQAVQLGTALLCTPEAGTSTLHRAALLEQRYAATVVTRAFSGRWARGLTNRFALEHTDAPGGYPEIHHLTGPLRAAASTTGDAEVPNLWAGTGWRSIRRAPAAEIVAAIAAGL